MDMTSPDPLGQLSATELNAFADRLRFGEPLTPDEAAEFLRRFDAVDAREPWIVTPQLPPETHAA